MRNRFGNDRDEGRDFAPRRDERGEFRGREEQGSRGWDREDQDRGSWGQERGERGEQGGARYAESPYGERGASRPGWYSRGHTGTYGAGTGGGYRGGYEGGGYGGSSGTDYSGSSYGAYAGDQGSSGAHGAYGGYGGNQRGYGGSQGAGYGTGRDQSRGSFGSSSDQGFRGRDFGSPASDLRRGQGGGFAGRGPKGYTRTDERIREDVCERLSQDDDVDATEIEVRVSDGEVTLEGSVETRRMKHQAEDLAESVTGVKDVHNNLRVMKGLLNELKDKVTGQDEPGHYANTGTKTTGSNGTIGHGRV